MVIVRLALAAFLVAAAGLPASAQQTSLGQFRDWGAYKAETGGNTICYVMSQPKDMEPKNVNRDPVHFFITTRPGQGVRNEVSIIIGYPFREGSRASAEVGSDSFTLFTRDNGAWVENAAEEARLVGAMRAGANMVVKGTSQRGTNTVDTYSLAGVTAALDRISQECN